MKKLSLLFLLLACTFMSKGAEWVKWDDKNEGVPVPAKYESFEDGVPETWVLQGKGKLSTNPWHYKLGRKSLQWDFKAGDVIQVNNTIGNPWRRGMTNNSCFATFSGWIYLKKAMPGRNLRIEFCQDEARQAYIDIPLNFVGWQYFSSPYKISNTSLKNKNAVSKKINNLRFAAPKDVDGRMLIDLFVYNGPVYSMDANVVPNKQPWRSPALDEKKYPVPSKVNEVDKRAIERILGEKCKVNITQKAGGKKSYEKAVKIIKELNIVEDVHGIRGKPINIIRTHAWGQFFCYDYCGIPRDEMLKFGLVRIAKYRRKDALWDVLFATTAAARNGITEAQYKNLCVQSVKFWKHLIDQGVNTSYGNGNYHPQTYIHVLNAVCKVKDALFEAGIMDEVFQYAQYKYYPLFTEKMSANMDSFGYCSAYFMLISLYSQDIRKQLQALRFVSGRLSRTIISDNGFYGFKPDGCGYHGGFAVDYYRYGLNGASKLAGSFAGTSFALTKEAFDTLKTSALRLYFYSNNAELPIFMQGTGPLERQKNAKYKCFLLADTLKNLALAAPGGCDKELAQAYVNLRESTERFKYFKYDDVFEKKYKIKPTAPPNGNISMPYAPLVAQRRKNWLAVAWAGGVDMRQRGNHYAYHTGNGPLSILGPGGFYGSGTGDGWDWNRTNGATVLYMPDITKIKYIHSGRKVPPGKEYLKTLMIKQVRATRNDPVIKRGNGGISWRGINGCSRKIFRGDRLYNDFGGIKSYFFIDDRIYALGSNIKSDNKKYHVQTNLYQKRLDKKDMPTYVDSREIKTFPVADQELDSKKTHYLIDPQDNGYYVPANQKLFVARKHQKSKDHKGLKETNGDFATAWLEHGIACKNAKYCYVIFPYCNKEKFAKFGKKDFEILRQDDFAHILHDKIDGFYAGIFFKGGDVTKLPQVKNVERDCQIMYRESNKKLEIAVGDPDVHRNWTNKLKYGQYGGKSELKPLKITFKGKWELETPVDGVKVLSSNKDKSVIEFGCIHGKTFNFTLIK